MASSSTDIATETSPGATPNRYRLDGGGLSIPHEAKLFAHAFFDAPECLGVLPQERLGVFPALSKPLAAIGEPCAALFDDALDHSEVEQVAFARDAFAVHDVELRLAERRRHFVLHDFDASTPADYGVAILDASDAANVDAHRRIELERPPTGRRFGIAEHDADFFTQLIDENQTGLRLRHRAGQLSQRL